MAQQSSREDSLTSKPKKSGKKHKKYQTLLSPADSQIEAAVFKNSVLKQDSGLLHCSSSHKERRLSSSGFPSDSSKTRLEEERDAYDDGRLVDRNGYDEDDILQRLPSTTGSGTEGVAGREGRQGSRDDGSGLDGKDGGGSDAGRLSRMLGAGQDGKGGGRASESGSDSQERGGRGRDGQDPSNVDGRDARIYARDGFDRQKMHQAEYGHTDGHDGVYGGGSVFTGDWEYEQGKAAGGKHGGKKGSRSGSSSSSTTSSRPSHDKAAKGKDGRHPKSLPAGKGLGSTSQYREGPGMGPERLQLSIPRRLQQAKNMLDYVNQIPTIQKNLEQRLIRAKLERPNIVMKTARQETVNQYLERHNINQLMEFLMKMLLSEQPKDPADYLYNLSRSIVKQQRCSERLPSLVDCPTKAVSS